MFCKKCGNQIGENDKVCLRCGEKIKRKKPVFKKWWFWVLMGLATIVTIAAISGGGEEVPSEKTPDTDAGVQNSQPADDKQSEQSKVEETVKYETVDLRTMITDLEENALRAEKNYQNKNIEVTGVIANFDSDGSYISIEPSGELFTFTSVMCYIKNDDQLNFLLEKSEGDTVTIKGKVTSVGEILGYSIKIEEVC